MKPPTTKTTTIPERTIMTKRPCKHCNNEIYLQFLKVTPKLQRWVSFDSSDGKLHDCPARPLALEGGSKLRNKVHVDSLAIQLNLQL
jgi:hypothetical protein